MLRKPSFAVLFLVLLASAAVRPSAASELVVYSARAEALIKPVFDAYTAETGVKIRFHSDKEGALLERLVSEDKRTPADLLMTVDAGNLWLAAEKGVLEPVKSKILEKNVPAHLRDSQGRWFGLSLRARTAAFNTEKLKAAELIGYEDLADSKWKGKLCLRSSKKVYNQSLVAMLIAEHGEEKAEKIVKGWVANLAAEPFQDDTALLKAIASGQCQVGLVNTYYFGRLMKSEASLPLALAWMNQKSSGVHVNVSGAGVVKHSKNKAEAVRFLEWLSSEKGQGLFAQLNLEFPVSPKAALAPEVEAWGKFKASQQKLVKAGELQPLANKLMDRAGYR